VATCERCGEHNPEGARFCVGCGAALGLVCAACGTDLPGPVRFCPSCGAPVVPESPTQEQRRVVSVLFADLVDFTARSQDADPEDVRDTLRRYHGGVKETIERFGGVVEKFIGDAVMAVFGAPVSRGDDAERAVRAALEIPNTIEELNRAIPELNLAVRVAVNTGETVVTLGARPAEGEAMVSGDVVNTAARLQSGATAGGILVGEGTYLATRRTIRYEPAPPVVAKGKREPVPAWIPLGPVEGEIERTDTPMLGRAREVELLRGVWDRAVSERRTHIVTVLGEPGIGKSRLAFEFAATLPGAGGRALVVRELPYELSAGYGGFGQLVKSVADIYETDTGESSRAKLAAGLERLGLTGGSTFELLSVFTGAGQEAAQDRRALFDAARQFVEAIGRERPTLIVYEDIHSAHPSSLDLIQFLAARTKDAPLVFLAMARPELLDLRPDWGGGMPSSTSIRLEPLSEDDAHKLATSILSTARPDVGARIEAIAEGNPLFLEELSTWVAEGGVSDQGLPTTVRAMIAARLDALPPPERDVLYDASVVGKVFWRGALERLRPERESLAETLDSLEARDLIRSDASSRLEGDAQFEFRHILIRDVAYATLPKVARRTRHEAVARFIEEEVHNPEGAAAIAAHHWREAGEPARAVDWLLVAASMAEKSWATNEAVQLYDTAVALVPPEDEARRRAVGTKRAVAALRFQHYVNDMGGWLGEDAGDQKAVKSDGETSPPIS
jgi:class 3 adenylate cyclase